jgi:putative membrane protein
MAESNMKIEESKGSLSDHLANERTFLAWVRTSIGIMAFGFVVVKFTLFVRQISLVLQKPMPIKSHGYSSAIGILLVAFGALIGLMAYLRYRLITKQLLNKNYEPSTLLSTLVAVSIVLIGILLTIYLILSVQQ